MGRLQRAIGTIYSLVADNLYEPIVVKGTFRLLGGNLNSLVLEQGQAAVQGARGGPILDMPVGTGYFTTTMAAAFDGLVVGADIAWGMVRHTDRVAQEKGVAHLVVVQADVHRLPFADGSFAAVVCSNGLQVIPGLRAALRELARVLAPEGTVFVSVVTVSLSEVLPRSASEHLPTLLRSGRDLAGEIEDAGLRVTSFRRDRLSYLVEAVKPAEVSRSGERAPDN